MKKMILLVTILASFTVLAGCSCMNPPMQEPAPQTAHHDYKGEG